MARAPISLIINGASGKMGQLASAALSASPLFKLVGQLGRGDDLTQQIHQTQAAVVLDFTRADVVYENTLTILEAGARPVIGTSGLTASQLQTLQQQCSALKRGALIVPNFSVGVLLLMRFAQMAAQFFPDAEIIERHHPQKFDAPSGTALKTAAVIHAGRQGRAPTVPFREAPARGACVEAVPIHAVRLPGVLAKQSVIFGGSGETLTVTHDTLDRSCFVPGILLACEQVMSLQSLMYGLEALIFHDT